MSKCKIECCKHRVFSKGLCKYHWQAQYGKPIKRVSDRHKDTLRKYSDIRKEFIDKHNECEARLPRCTHIATDIHHIKGKDSENLWLDTNFFMAVCRNCHTKIEEGGDWVYERGFKEHRF